MMKYCFIRDSSFNDLNDKYEFETGLVLAEKGHLVLTDSPHSTRIVQSQSDSAHDVFSQSNTENAVRLIGNLMASGTDGRILFWTACFIIGTGAFVRHKRR